MVRYHPLYFAEVAGAYQGAFAQLAFTFLVFRGEDVAQVRMSALHFPGRGFLEALRRAFVRFQFRHKSSELTGSFPPFVVKKSQPQRALRYTKET